MQHISEKLTELLSAKGIFQKDFAPEVGYDYRHLNRKISLKSAWSARKVALAAKFLGVTPEYLLDESRPYYHGDPIPPDALAKPTPKPADPSGGDALAAVIEIAKRQFDELKGVAARTESTSSSDQAVDILSNILEEMKSLRVNMDRVLEHLDLHSGEHDQD